MSKLTWAPAPARWRLLLVVTAVAAIAIFFPRSASATITQGDSSVLVTAETREAGRWGEGGSKRQQCPDRF